MKLSSALFAVFATVSMAAPTHDTMVLVDTLFPNYLVPLMEAEPDTPQGTLYTGTINWVSAEAHNEITLIAGFDVPKNDATKCMVKFRLSKANKPNWNVTGSGHLDYYGLTRPVDYERDTWRHRPARASQNGEIKVNPEASEFIVTGSIPCHQGKRMDFELVAHKAAGPTKVHWYELRSPKTGITIEMYK